MADNLDIGASSTTSNPYAMAGIGIAGGMLSNYMGMNNQQNLNSQQLQNQMHLNEQMQQIQQENWDYTNYENQVKHLERAGLNAGLIYGMSGGGGSTMGGASGGSAQGGQAHQPQFDITANMLQAKQLENQTKVAEATADRETAAANKLRAETPTSGNLGDATFKDIMATAEGKKISNAYNSGNLETALEMSKQVLENTKAENKKLVAEGKKEQIEADYEERQQKLKLISQGIENLYKLQLTKESKAKITNMQEMLKIEQQNANSNDRNSKANSRNADANFSNSLTNSLRQLRESLGENANTENEKVIDNLTKLLGMGAIGIGQAAKGGNTYNYNSNFH